MATSCIPSGHSTAVEAAFDRLADIDIEALTGQRVRVESRTGGIHASLLLFGLPLAALVSTVAIAKTTGMTDGMSVIWGFWRLCRCHVHSGIVPPPIRRSLWHITAIIDNKNRLQNNKIKAMSSMLATALLLGLTGLAGAFIALSDSTTFSTSKKIRGSTA